MRRRREWRLLGALALAVGGSLALAGSILPWAVVHYSPRFLGIQIDRVGRITHPVQGIDLTEGRLTLAVAIAVVAAAVVAAVLRKMELRITVAGGAAAAAIFLLGYGGYEATQVHDAALDRYNPFRSDAPLTALHLRQLLAVSHGVGLYLIMAGGTAALVGALVIGRVTRRDR